VQYRQKYRDSFGIAVRRGIVSIAQHYRYANIHPAATQTPTTIKIQEENSSIDEARCQTDTSS